jgi:hypothetical protein
MHPKNHNKIQIKHQSHGIGNLNVAPDKLGQESLGDPYP